jgi:hypothetical protein
MRVFGTLVRSARLLVPALLAGMMPGLAQAQTGPQSRPITVTFDGTVTNSATDQVMIRQPDGSFAPYRGPMPNYPFRDGDQVRISFSTTVPTAAFYAGAGQISADGIYRIQLRGPNNVGGSPFGNVRDFGVTTNGSASGIRPTSEPYGIGGAVIVYNANTDSYSLQFGNAASGSTTGTVATFDAPGLNYDPATGALTADTSSCQNGICPPSGAGGVAIALGADKVNVSRVPVWGRDPSQPGSLAEALWGFFDFGFSGSWSLPASSAGSSGGPVEVPEPSMLLLFGGGAAIIMRRRRRQAA